MDERGWCERCGRERSFFLSRSKNEEEQGRERRKGRSRRERRKKCRVIDKSPPPCLDSSSSGALHSILPLSADRQDRIGDIGHKYALASSTQAPESECRCSAFSPAPGGSKSLSNGGAIFTHSKTHALGCRGPLGRELGRGPLVAGLEIELGSLGADRRVLCGGRRGHNVFGFCLSWGS